MSALARFASPARDAAIVLLGTGMVGSALLQLLATPAAAGLQLVGVADSERQLARAHGLVPVQARRQLHALAGPRDESALLAALDASGIERRVVVDATASERIAARHAHWLARGCDVVSANKAAIGGSLDGWNAVHRAAAASGATYGDAATVGAGLPVLSTLRRLRRCGDRLRAIEGVFSGSLSWLFNRFDGRRPFSVLLREARALGYTEPDPRVDLGGGDVVRKLLILARSAGHAVDAADVEVRSLVPAHLRDLDADAFLRRAAELDEPLEARRANAAADGCVLRHLAVRDAGGRAHVGLAEVATTHPCATLAGTDNLYALTTDRYRAQPLVIRGPGAGPEVTAQALLGDLLALRRSGAAG